MAKFSQAIEDYLKQIYMLEERGVKPTGKALSECLDISQASVTQMLKRLANLNLIAYEPYQPIKLTTAGRKIALEIVRHHRLLESYLADVLGMQWHEVHEEAEVLEHHISERMEALIAEKLGHPSFDPHGHPIPTIDGSVPNTHTKGTLFDAKLEVTLRVSTVHDDRPEVLQFLGERGIIPGSQLRLIDRSEVADTVTIAIGNKHHVFSSKFANSIDVHPVQKSDSLPAVKAAK